MVLIKLRECCCAPRGRRRIYVDSSTDAWQSGLVFFLSRGSFFFPVLFSIRVACIRKHLAEMCRGQRRESVACFVFQCRLPDCLWESE